MRLPHQPPALILSLILALAATACDGSAGPVPHGSPDAAQRYEAAKRMPLDRPVDTRAAYRAAEIAAARLPRHSVALGGVIAGPLSRAATRELKGKWKALGPGNVGGRMRTIAIDPGNPERMLVGGVSGGVWRTDDGGGSWDPVGDELQNVAVNAMAMSPADPDTIYVGTGEGYFREDVRGTGLPLRGGGIFRSDDAGDGWRMLPGTEGQDFWFVNDLVVSPVAADRVYAATRTGVWRTLDGGATWARTLDPDVQGGCLDLALRSDGSSDVLFAACGTFERAAVHRTRNADGASKWESVLSEPAMGRTSLAIAPSDPDVIYALAASNAAGYFEQGLHAVFRSSSGGDAGSWEARIRNDDADFHHTVLLHNPVASVSSGCGFGPSASVPMGWYVNVIAVDPIDPDVVWAAGVDWFRSADGGRTWGPASFWWPRGAPSWAHADQHVMAFHPGYDGAANQIVFAGNDGGLFRSDNARASVSTGPLAACDPASTAVAWLPLNNGLEITQFYQGLPFPEGDSYLGGAQDNGTILRPPGSGPDGWLGILGGDGGYVAIDPRDPDVIYASTQFSDFRKSVDGGGSFTSVRAGLPDVRSSLLSPGQDFLFITPLAMDPADPDTLWTGGRSIHRTTNGAAGWETASRKLNRGSLASAVAIAPSDPDRVLVGTDKGFLLSSDRARSADARTRWPSKRPRQAWVTWVAFDPDDADTMYATYGGFGGPHVFRSDDGGRRWRSIDGAGAGALPDVPVHVIVIDPDDPARLFLGTDLGVFVSTDGGGSWAQEIAGFGNIVTESLTLQRRGARLFLYAFTHGRGAWMASVRPAR